MTDNGIAWSGEAKKYKISSYSNDQVLPPPNWALQFPDGYTDANPIPDLGLNEHFQVWMRTSGLPTFRKLYYRNDNEIMQPGRYEIQIFMSASIISIYIIYSSLAF